MKNILNTAMHWKIIFMLFILTGCTNKIERSGFVVDSQTNDPLQNVNIEIYLKYQRGDSLREKVYTDRNGYFYIREKRGKKLLFEVQKTGYIGFVSSLSTENDTIKLERDTE